MKRDATRNRDSDADVKDIHRLLARAFASVKADTDRAQWELRFFDNLQAGAIGAGRIMSAARTAIQTILINGFAQPVGDCIQGVDGSGFPGIHEPLREAGQTMRRGGGVGDDSSRIRPRGAAVKGTASLAARGGFLRWALRDRWKVVWGRSPVRMGTHQKAGDTQAPMWRDSVAAAIACAVQTLIAQRDGAMPASGQASPVVVQDTPGMMRGKTRGECSAHAVIRKHGCDCSTQCGHLGVCG